MLHCYITLIYHFAVHNPGWKHCFNFGIAYPSPFLSLSGPCTFRQASGETHIIFIQILHPPTSKA
jgi:hypothetical protein